jgi:aminomethyltransferase
MTLLQTPLHAAHVRLGARMVEFGGWDMPVQFAGIVEEHAHVRSACGIFDVSHMGELLVSGPGAEALLQATTPNDVSKLKVGRAHYSSFLTDRGTFVDDLLVYRLGEQQLMVVVNAGNIAKDLAWIQAARDRLAGSLPGPVAIEDRSAATALIAVQGPRALEVVEAAYESATAAPPPRSLKYYAFAQGGQLGGRPVTVLSRTGYTGEDGFEVYLAAEDAEAAWEALLRRPGVRPVGLGARDTLRLEAGMCLYGDDIDEQATPIEAGLQWTVKPEKGAFTGRDVLVQQLRDGTARTLVGLEVTGRGIARHGHEVWLGDECVGVVTSGTHAPTVGKAVAMAYVPPRCAAPGTDLHVDVRGRRVEARVVPLPFYSRTR